MVVIVCMGIEIDLSAVNRQRTQQSRLGKIVQRIVYRRQRDPYMPFKHGGTDLLRRYVFAATVKQPARQSHPLPRRAQTRALQKSYERIILTVALFLFRIHHKFSTETPMLRRGRKCISFLLLLFELAFSDRLD